MGTVYDDLTIVSEGLLEWVKSVPGVTITPSLRGLSGLTREGLRNYTDAVSSFLTSASVRRREARGRSSANCSGVRALAIGATTAGRVGSHASAAAATVVRRSAA